MVRQYWKDFGLKDSDNRNLYSFLPIPSLGFIVHHSYILYWTFLDKAVDHTCLLLVTYHQILTFHSIILPFPCLLIPFQSPFPFLSSYPFQIPFPFQSSYPFLNPFHNFPYRLYYMLANLTFQRDRFMEQLEQGLEYLLCCRDSWTFQSLYQQVERSMALKVLAKVNHQKVHLSWHHLKPITTGSSPLKTSSFQVNLLDQYLEVLGHPFDYLKRCHEYLATMEHSFYPHELNHLLPFVVLLQLQINHLEPLS